jgi:hypothetical protein
MKIGYSFLLVLLIVAAQSCKQKLDVAGPYLEEPVVYGLLDPYADTQYVRIEKGYLLQGNAYIAAGIPDSIYYPDILNVQLRGSNGRNYQLVRMVANEKDTGLFARSPNYLYFYYHRGVPIDSTQSYTLYDSNTVSNKVVTAQTGLVSHFQVDYPQPGYPIHLSNSSPQMVSWNNAPNAGVYDLTIRFFYLEYSSTTNQVVKDTFIDIPILRSFSPGPNSTQTAQISENAIIGYLANNLELNNTQIYRQFNLNKCMQFKFVAGGTDLANFFLSQQAQSGLASSDALPPYTNIKGGVGLFSSRYYEEVDSVVFVPSSLDSLSCGPLSAGLRFKNPLNGSYCP